MTTLMKARYFRRRIQELLAEDGKQLLLFPNDMLDFALSLSTHKLALWRLIYPEQGQQAIELRSAYRQYMHCLKRLERQSIRALFPDTKISDEMFAQFQEELGHYE